MTSLTASPSFCLRLAVGLWLRPRRPDAFAQLYLHTIQTTHQRKGSMRQPRHISPHTNTRTQSERARHSTTCGGLASLRARGGSKRRRRPKHDSHNDTRQACRLKTSARACRRASVERSRSAVASCMRVCACVLLAAAWLLGLCAHPAGNLIRKLRFAASAHPETDFSATRRTRLE